LQHSGHIRGERGICNGLVVIGPNSYTYNIIELHIFSQLSIHTKPERATWSWAIWAWDVWAWPVKFMLTIWTISRAL